MPCPYSSENGLASKGEACGIMSRREGAAWWCVVWVPPCSSCHEGSGEGYGRGNQCCRNKARVVSARNRHETEPPTGSGNPSQGGMARPCPRTKRKGNPTTSTGGGGRLVRHRIGGMKFSAGIQRAGRTVSHGIQVNPPHKAGAAAQQGGGKPRYSSSARVL